MPVKAEVKKETWRNETRGRIGVVKFDRNGDISHELLRSGASVHLTTEERLINSERAASQAQDPFKNGKLVPVRLFDAEDAKEIASNPNLRSEDELRELFNLHWKKFEIEIAEISNMITLERLKVIAQEGDATVRQVNVIESRMTDLNPSRAVDVTLAGYGANTPTPAPVSMSNRP